MGTRPADVCGCFKKPMLSSSAMTFLMVAGLTPRAWFMAMAFELTGSAVLI